MLNQEIPMLRKARSTVSIAVILGVCSCGGVTGGDRASGPTPPPDSDRAAASTETCKYLCANYHYAAGQCFQGWACDAMGTCLTYVGTPDAATSCPAPTPPCIPTTCAAQGAECGSISDNCGGMLSCGTCSSSGTCGGGGKANVCGTPASQPWRNGLPTGRVNLTFHVQEQCSQWSDAFDTQHYGSADDVTITGDNPGALYANFWWVDARVQPFSVMLDEKGSWNLRTPNAHGETYDTGTLGGRSLYVDQGSYWSSPSSGEDCSGSMTLP